MFNFFINNQSFIFFGTRVPLSKNEEIDVWYVLKKSKQSQTMEI